MHGTETERRGDEEHKRLWVASGIFGMGTSDDAPIVNNPLRAPLGDFVQTLRGLLAARRPRGGNLRSFVAARE